MRADAAITRTKEEAKKLAEDLLAKLKKNPGDFETLAKENSSCPSAQNGGDLGNWQKGRMVPEFDQAIGKLKVGEISPEVVETSFGFHVMRRNKAVPPQELSAQHILIAYKGAVHAKPEVTRTKEEAKALAEKSPPRKPRPTRPSSRKSRRSTRTTSVFIKMPNWITGRENAQGFRRGRDGREDRRGWRAPWETEFGYHVFLRTEVVKPPVFSRRAHPDRLQGRAARRFGRDAAPRKRPWNWPRWCWARPRRDPSKFKDLATMYSNDPTVKMNGGDLGQWPKGRMVPAFDQAIENMEIGKVGRPHRNGLRLSRAAAQAPGRWKILPPLRNFLLISVSSGPDSPGDPGFSLENLSSGLASREIVSKLLVGKSDERNPSPKSGAKAAKRGARQDKPGAKGVFEMTETRHVNVAIIGSGPAGYTAAIYTARAPNSGPSSSRDFSRADS